MTSGLPLHEARGKLRKQVETVLREAEDQPDILTIDVAQFAERRQERCQSAADRIGRGRRVRHQEREPGLSSGELRAGVPAGGDD